MVEVTDDTSLAALDRGVQDAEDAFRDGRYREALDGYASLLRSRLASGGEGESTKLCGLRIAANITRFAAADLVVIERLADLSTLFGLFDAADDLLTTMVMLTRSARNGFATDYAQIKRIELALARGNIAQSFELLRELDTRLFDIDLSPSRLAEWEGSTEWRVHDTEDRAILLTRAYLVFGRLLAASGQYNNALQCIDRGLWHAASSRSDLARQSHIPLQLTRALALLERGDIVEAAEYSLRLVDAKADALSPAFAIQALELCARTNMLRGRFGPAVERFEQVAIFCARSGFPRAVALAQLNLAHILILLNRLVEANAYLAEAARAALAINDSGLVLRVQFLINVAEARRRSSAQAIPIGVSVTEMARGSRRQFAAEPKRVSEASRVDLEQSDNFLSFFDDRALEFHMALGRRDLADAQDRLYALLDTFNATDSSLISCRLVVLRGLFAYACGEFAAALGLFEKAAVGLAALDLKPELWQVLDLRGRCAARLGREELQRCSVEAAEALLTELMDSLSDAERITYLLSRATAEENYIGVQADLLSEQKAALATTSPFVRPLRRIRLLRRLNRLLSHVDAYKTTLADRAVGMRDCRRTVPGLSLLRRLLFAPRDRITLSTLVLPDRVLLIRSGFLKLDFGVSPISRIQLRDLVRRLHQRMQHIAATRDLGALPSPAPMRPGETCAEAVSTALADALQLEPALRGLPRRVSALTIVPDDVLHGLPFAALPHDGRPLVERFAVSVAFDHRPGRVGHRRPRGEAVIVAVSGGTDNVPSLPKTIEEADRIGHWCAERGLPVRRLVDREARKDAVLRRLESAALFHIACHGVFEPERPDASGMLLITGPAGPEVLTLSELAQVSLDCCRHVTLSSCWSADNFILPGRWVVSLPETLFRAGAESVLGSLWPVDDEVAAELMTIFYRELDRCPRDVALRRAQLACRNGKLLVPNADHPDGMSNAFNDPFFWAGFVMYGNPGRIRL